jgi:hypothetical protein
VGVKHEDEGEFVRAREDDWVRGLIWQRRTERRALPHVAVGIPEERVRPRYGRYARDTL